MDLAIARHRTTDCGLILSTINNTNSVRQIIARSPLHRVRHYLRVPVQLQILADTNREIPTKYPCRDSLTSICRHLETGLSKGISVASEHKVVTLKSVCPLLLSRSEWDSEGDLRGECDIGRISTRIGGDSL